MASKRTIFDLSVDELEKVIQLNVWPEGIGLEGIEERADYERLWRHRHQPKYIARVLSSEQRDEASSEAKSLRAENLRIRKLEAEAKLAKATTQAEYIKQLGKKLDDVLMQQTMQMNILQRIIRRLEEE